MLSNNGALVTAAERRQTAAGLLLRNARFELRISQRELAERAGVAQSTIARIEAGRTDPGLESLYRILATVGLEPRIRLEQVDDHDRVLAALDAKLSEEDRVAARDSHERAVQRFRKARPSTTSK